MSTQKHAKNPELKLLLLLLFFSWRSTDQQLICNFLVIARSMGRECLLAVTNQGSSPVVVKVAPLFAPWQETPANAPREIPDWLDIFPVSVRIAPKVGLQYVSRLLLCVISWLTNACERSQACRDSRHAHCNSHHLSCDTILQDSGCCA